MTTGRPQEHSITRDAAPDAPTQTPIEASAAQRQPAYRQRRRRAAIEAIGQETTASRVTLLTMLAHDLAALEARTTLATMIRATRNSAKRVLNAIITRYGIEL